MGVPTYGPRTNPVYEEFLTKIINVHWPSKGGYALVWIFAFAPYGYHEDNEPKLSDENGDDVEFNPSIKGLMDGAKIVYSRVVTEGDQTHFPKKTYWGVQWPAQIMTLTDTVYDSVVWTGSNSAPSLSFFAAHDPDTYAGLTTPQFTGTSDPDHPAKWYGRPLTGGTCTPLKGGEGVDPYGAYDGNGTGDLGMWTEENANNLYNWWNALPVYSATDLDKSIFGGAFIGSYASPDNDPLVLGHTYAQHRVTQTISQGHVISTDHVAGEFEAVFLIKLPLPTEDPQTAFSIHTNAGYECDITVQIYPAKGISVDTSNTSSPPPGPFPDHVYTPLKWSSGSPPNDPTGAPWPGYNINGSPPTDVINAAMWNMTTGTNFGSGDQIFPFVYYQTPHLITPPDPEDDNPMVKDKITELYLDSLPDAGEGPFYLTYCDVPYGTVFDGSAFGTDPGPLPKIASDS